MRSDTHETFGAWERPNSALGADDGSNLSSNSGIDGSSGAGGSKGYGQRDVTRSEATPFDPHRNGIPATGPDREQDRR